MVDSVTGKGVRVFLMATARDRVAFFKRAELAWRSITEATGGMLAWIGSSTKDNAGKMARMTHRQPWSRATTPGETPMTVDRLEHTI
jgi:hypothetical protein